MEVSQIFYSFFVPSHSFSFHFAPLYFLCILAWRQVRRHTHVALPWHWDWGGARGREAVGMLSPEAGPEIPVGPSVSKAKEALTPKEPAVHDSQHRWTGGWREVWRCWSQKMKWLRSQEGFVRVQLKCIVYPDCTHINIKTMNTRIEEVFKLRVLIKWRILLDMG